MKHMHLHVSVDDLDKSIGFIRPFFCSADVTKRDYAKMNAPAETSCSGAKGGRRQDMLLVA